MSTTTTRIELVKETESENYSVVTVNNNSDRIDAAVGFEACTSSTRPSTIYNGKGIRETDTGRVLVSNGTAPASGSWATQLWTPNGPVIVGAVGVNAPLRAETTSTLVNNRVLDARKQGESNPGFQLDFDGRMQWGPGGGTLPDAWLYRSSAGVLTAGGDIAVGSARLGVISRGVVGRGSRPAASLGTAVDATDIMVLRVSSLSLTAGRLYCITTTPLALDSDTTNDEIGARIRYRTDGVVATASSTILPGSNVSTRQTDANVPDHRTINAWLAPSSNVTASFVLCVRRIAGAGTCRIALDTAAGDAIDLVILDCGTDPGDTGTDL